MIGELCFNFAGKWWPAYRLDLSGNLIRCSATGPAAGLIPFATTMVTSADDIECPRPWTLTPEKVLERLASVEKHFDEVRSAYPDLQISKANVPFVPHVGRTEDDAAILEALNMYPALGSEEAATLSEALRDSGVFPIPAIEVFSDAIHEVVNGGISVPPLRQVAVGWMSCIKIYRKALVQSA